jgi:hypothetical protein
MAVAKPAEPRIVDLLVSAGVGLTTWTLPAELRESHAGNPFNYDDLLSFHFELQSDEWQNHLSAESERFEQ